MPAYSAHTLLAQTTTPANNQETAALLEPDLEAESLLSLPDVQAFVNVFSQIRNHYVEEVDDKTLMKNAIRGMLSQLDPHSNYLEPDSFSELQDSANGEFGGVGLEVGLENGFIKVIAPIDDTPAQKAGIESVT